MLSTLKKLLGRTPRMGREEVLAVFNKRYASFKDLLQANADLANVLAELNAALDGTRHLEVGAVRKQARRAIFHCETMVSSLGRMSHSNVDDLENVLHSITARIENELEQRARGDILQFTLPLSEVDASMAYSVGGKNANLGELRNMLDMPVPRGFAITIRTCAYFLLRTSGLFKTLMALLRAIDPEKPASIAAATRQVEKLILAAPVTDDVGAALYAAWDAAFDGQADVVAALRSSAIAEDGVQSFAGQYRSILGVTRAGLLDAFKMVVASLFSQRALTYRAEHGYALDAMGMGMCCLEMVRAKAAGVAFSRHPVDLRSNAVVINGLWGLGELVVDGSFTPDQWLVSRANNRIVKASVAHKTHRLVQRRTADGGVENQLEPVPAAAADQPCLDEAHVRALARMALELERHYQYPQDLEWAVDEQDRIILLQTRPMGLDNAAREHLVPELGGLAPLLAGGDVAARGVGCGPVVHVGDGEDLTHFPEGAVMLLAHSSPNAMGAMRRASAIVAETGSLTGHMAAICREFGVPTLMNLPGAVAALAEGAVVTVDALSGRVFAGEVPELLSMRLMRPKATGNSAALSLLRRVSPYILPLHLVDPRAETFTPGHCTSLHDIMRYVHEQSYTRMFQISDNVTDNSAGVACHLVCRLPINVYIIDLGGGLREEGMRAAQPADVQSLPLACLLEGMLHPAVQAHGPRPVNMRGFFSVMGQSLLGDNQETTARFGQNSYAIVSDRYCNFSSRVGYHYAIMDCWCGDTVSKNYIRFEFAGGAAGNLQRERRVRCIGVILRTLGFTVDIQGDRLRARYQKYHKEEMLPRLNQLGRLLIMTRQMDMLMVDEGAVQGYADKFLNGEYH